MKKEKLKFKVGDLVLVKKLTFPDNEIDPDMQIYLRKIGRVIRRDYNEKENYPYTIKFYRKYNLFDGGVVDFAEEELEIVNKTTKLLYG